LTTPIPVDGESTTSNTVDPLLFSVSLRQEQICLPDRKSKNPIKLPLTDGTLKAIAAYIIGARAKSKERALFLSLKAPYASIAPFTKVKNDCI
jgi:hypothetical protein